MTIHVHRLTGCAPTPLAHYLKSLGVLRIVAEQKDPNARGFFRDDVFHLATTLDGSELVRFLLDDYRPAPIVTPWNGGSGFYPKDAKIGLQTIAASSHPRFAAYRDALECARSIVAGRKEAPKDDEKAALLAACRARFGEGALCWLNAAIVLGADDGRTAYPALLGTGGNDGRLDFANNFMQRLCELVPNGLPTPSAGALLAHALYRQTVPGLDREVAIGQFLPGSAGGVNATSGFEGESLVDAWDFVLALEGALVLAVASVRRLDAAGLPQASAPFAVRSSATGYGSAARSEEPARGEQWMPVWSTPSTLADLRALFAEGRLQIGRDRAARAVDAARAIARLGVARGIDAFERYAYLERNGRSNLAVPLGRWPVRAQPHVHLLDEIAPWVTQLRDATRRDGAPQALARDVQRIEEAMLAVCREGGLPSRWERLLAIVGEVEAGLVRRPKATGELRLRPVPTLSAGWIAAASSQGDGDIELRLATAIASQVMPAAGEDTPHRRAESVRVHLLPLEERYGEARFATGAQGLTNDPRAIWSDRDLIADLCALVGRRLVESAATSAPGLGLYGRVLARLDDIDAFLLARADDSRIARLVRPLMAIDFGSRDALDAVVGAWRHLPSSVPILPAYGLFRAVYATQLGEARADLRVVRPDAAPLRRLLADDLQGAASQALRRLEAMGARARIHRIPPSRLLARRIAASLAIPISARDLGRALDAVCKPTLLETITQE